MHPGPFTRAVPLSQGTDRGEAGWSFQRAWDSNLYCLWGPGPGIFSCSLAQLSPALLDTSSGSSRSISPHSIRCPDLFSSLPCAAAATKSRVLVSCGREQDTKGREGKTWVLKALGQHLQGSQPGGGLAEPGPGRETGRELEGAGWSWACKP